jgi:serralysin
VYGGEDNDSLNGGAGEDVVAGEKGDDTVVGGTGADTLSGGEDDDNLLGGGGNDRLNGGSSADNLTGGAGNDVLIGGEGDDNFLFSTGSNYDRIFDFSTTNDKIGINAAGVDDFNDLLILQKAGGHAVVRWDDGGAILASVTLLDVSPLSLSSGDFIFDF